MLITFGTGVAARLGVWPARGAWLPPSLGPGAGLALGCRLALGRELALGLCLGRLFGVGVRGRGSVRLLAVGRGGPAGYGRAAGALAGAVDDQPDVTIGSVPLAVDLLGLEQADRGRGEGVDAPYLCSSSASTGSGWRGVRVVGGTGGVRADAQPYLGPRFGMAPGRRHDG